MIINRITGRVHNLFYVSINPNLETEILEPGIPNNFLTKGKYEDWQTPRIPLYTSVDDAISATLLGKKVDTGISLSVYKPLGIRNENLLETSITTVPYTMLFPEFWYCLPLRFRKICDIQVLGETSDLRYHYGPRSTQAKVYRYEWEEVLRGSWDKPKLKQFSIGSKAKMGLAAASVYGGYKAIKGSNKGGRISGQAKFYHGTKSENVDSIKENGLQVKHAKDKDTLLKTTYGKDYIKNDENVYLARNKQLAEEVNRARYINSLPENEQFDAEWDMQDSDSEHSKKYKKSQSVLDVQMHRSDYKKLKKNENPELLGAKNRFDFVKKYHEKNKDRMKKEGAKVGPVWNAIRTPALVSGYKDFKYDTATIGEDIKSKYIKGSKDFEERSKVKDFKRNVKENPKDVAAGIGRVLGGTAAIATGAKYILKHK